MILSLASHSGTSSFGPAVIAVVLAAALLHATWNAIAHGIGDRLTGFALMGLVDIVAGGTVAMLAGPLPATAWPYIVASVVLHTVYNLLLLQSYRLGEFSQAYPLARGLGPLIVTAVSVFWLGRTMPTAQLVGVLLICVGLVAVVAVGGRPRRDQLPGLAAATATGVMIASYTVVDALAVNHVPLAAFIGWTFFLQGPAMPAVALLRHRRQFVPMLRTHAMPGLIGGGVALVAYSLVLWAQTSGALAPVAALRESSIVFGAVLGAVFLGERLGHRRAIAATVVVSGVVALTTQA